jgi:hypothetical protein
MDITHGLFSMFDHGSMDWTGCLRLECPTKRGVNNGVTLGSLRYLLAEAGLGDSVPTSGGFKLVIWHVPD